MRFRFERLSNIQTIEAAKKFPGTALNHQSQAAPDAGEFVKCYHL